MKRGVMVGLMVVGMACQRGTAPTPLPPAEERGGGVVEITVEVVNRFGGQLTPQAVETWVDGVMGRRFERPAGTYQVRVQGPIGGYRVTSQGCGVVERGATSRCVVRVEDPPPPACPTAHIPHVWGSRRLKGLDNRECRTLRGVVQLFKVEHDGDFTLYVTPPSEAWLWEGNEDLAVEGTVLVEGVCHAPPETNGGKAACVGFPGPLAPKVQKGMTVMASGFFVRDRQHTELHPALWIVVGERAERVIP